MLSWTNKKNTDTLLLKKISYLEHCLKQEFVRCNMRNGFSGSVGKLSALCLGGYGSGRVIPKL